MNCIFDGNKCFNHACSRRDGFYRHSSMSKSQKTYDTQILFIKMNLVQWHGIGLIFKENAWESVYRGNDADISWNMAQLGNFECLNWKVFFGETFYIKNK